MITEEQEFFRWARTINPNFKEESLLPEDVIALLYGEDGQLIEVPLEEFRYFSGRTESKFLSSDAVLAPVIMGADSIVTQVRVLGILDGDIYYSSYRPLDNWKKLTVHDTEILNLLYEASGDAVHLEDFKSSVRMTQDGRLVHNGKVVETSTKEIEEVITEPLNQKCTLTVSSRPPWVL